ncbi:MAG TPA: NAD(P) transhydrogenase subunit alpha [Thermoleophilia bacterium]|jgi:NAD(P) transhydrogenase subunit alpha|nr:NAD(P) transhydrogenase subunit alpha [Acidobacteriota bacterium]NLT92532.1 NAD(P) transhydrogenase subunit alpha [Actinomycetota bacterium]HQF51921.1 NAD(P) transhydrogenase subunit alpha [Thermoleophilia bacterium]HQH21073.1 NAD(P) transhydrogenase subunit alpha [Thermoleophilia bacterium]HQJ25765.1 NAD(P) transhydrogenase subunit alpha [Thermoleophilia bacterium]
MVVGIPKEILENEGRVAALPSEVAEYVKMGFEVLVETNAGAAAFQSDDDYKAAGASIVADVADLWDRADIILKVKQPEPNTALGKHEAELMSEGKILITFLHPANPSNHGFVRTLAERKVTALTMDGIPRISRAQTMDALTSMSTITGYKSVIMGAHRLPEFIPMIGTAIGVTRPRNCLIIGTGVVGLQAVATAKRLGGVVRALDIREAARTEADSLGAKIAGFEVPPEIAMAEGGYARSLPQEWLEKEREALKPVAVDSDLIILSALVPGEVAPVLITEEMVAGMRPGSVIIDVSVDQGGNCACTQAGKEVYVDGVLVSAIANIPGSMPVVASWLYGKNMLEYVKNLFKNGLDAPDWDDDIVQSTLVTRGGEIVHKGTLQAMGVSSEGAAS